jgi:uncharacterized protein
MIFCKRISILLCLILAIAVTPSCQNQKKDSLPEPIGYVNDFEDILSQAQENYLDSMISEYDKKTTIQISLITIDTSMTSRNDFDDYILQMANHWGVGEKGKDNGIAIGISKGYRTMRIQNGYGIEKLLSDSETKNIIDTAFIPSFKKGEYFEGIVNGLKAIMNKLH